jgi:two-component system, NarL family, response regulator NreC
MPNKIQVLIVDTDCIMRDGLVALLSNENCEVIGTASTGPEALRETELHAPDLVIIDLSIPTASDPNTIVQLKKQRPGVRVLVLTFLREERLIDAALRAGADGYVLKSDTRLEFVTAIRNITHGNAYVSPSIYDRVINGYLKAQVGAPRRRASGALSQREQQVVRLIAEGYRTREIAQQLSLSHKTVEKHRTNLMRKLGLKTAPAVAAYAIAHGYLDR